MTSVGAAGLDWDLASGSPEGAGQTQLALILQNNHHNTSLDLVVSNTKQIRQRSRGRGGEERTPPDWRSRSLGHGRDRENNYYILVK